MPASLTYPKYLIEAFFPRYEWIRVTAPDYVAVFCYDADTGRVVDADPKLTWTIGQTLETIVSQLRAENGTTMKVLSPHQFYRIR